MLETVAIIGPARFGVPLTQAATAPIIGRLHARGTGRRLQFAIVGLLRLIHNTATTAFFIWVIAGGLDAYAGTYDALGRRLGLDVGTADALVLTAVGLVAWCMFATVVQVLSTGAGCRRGRDSRRAPRRSRRRRSTMPTSRRTAAASTRARSRSPPP